MPLLECIDVSCGYLGIAVLQHISFEIGSGESVALLGPNGSGKSTLLKTITKTLTPISGEIRVEGKRVDKMSFADAATKIAFVPQEETPAYAFSVREVVTLGRIARSQSLWDSPEDRQAATDAMRRADCLHLESRSVTELSGGEKQRALIARALTQDTQLLLLDEPTSHLDVGHQLAVSELIKGLATDGRTVITAVHDLNLAAKMADRAILLADGVVVLDAPVEQVLESDLLDQVYGVCFERIPGSDGRVRVFGSL